MNRIASFSVDHDKLTKGMYISRIDGDCVTYDIRMIKPNNEEDVYLPNAALHTFEHLFATYMRNTEYADKVVYVGPMGCRTGFYLILRDSISYEKALELVRNCFVFIRNFEGIVPGTQRKECGNYKEHDLDGAKIIAEDMSAVLADWSAARMDYDYKD